MNAEIRRLSRGKLDRRQRDDGLCVCGHYQREHENIWDPESFRHFWFCNGCARANKKYPHTHHEHQPSPLPAATAAADSALDPVAERGTDGATRDQTSSAISDRDRIAFLRTLLNAYRRKRAVDGLNNRNWHADVHWKAEQDIVQLEAQWAEWDAERVVGPAETPP